MNTTQTFPTRDVLSTITGVLIGKIGGVYEVLNWMTGESVFTHQIPRISREAVPVIIQAHPQLQQAIDEADLVNEGNWEQWRRTWEDRYGLEISIPKFCADTHERIDPLSELAEKVHPSKIVVVKR